jgi:hypothetical protein
MADRLHGFLDRRYTVPRNTTQLLRVSNIDFFFGGRLNEKL